MIQTQPLEIKDFSGGITDHAIDTDLNKAQELDNFLVTENRKLRTRPGSELFDQNAPQVPLGSFRIGTLINYDQDTFLLAHAGRRIYKVDSGAWTEILGPTGNPVFNSTTSTAHRVSYAQWNRHVFVTNDNYSPVQKIFRNNSGVFQVRNAGLPRLASSPTLSGNIQRIIDLANNLRDNFNSHITNVASHPGGPDAGNLVTLPYATNLATLIALVSDLLIKYNAHEADATPASGWSFHAGQESANHSLATTAAPTDLASVVDRLRDLSTKFNSHDADDSAHGVASIHPVTVVEDTINSYLYAFVYYYTYASDNKTFEDYGAPLEVQLSGVLQPHLSPISISAIPVLVNGANDNWDTANIKVQIYRTTSGGTLFYKVGEVTNGTTTFTDNVNDKDLIKNPVLYTAGDVVDNDPVPLCSIFHIAGNIAYAADLKEGTQLFPNRLRQSVPGDVDAFPEEFYVDVDQKIMGVSSVRGTPIVLTTKGIYRIDGAFDELGQGGMVAQLIDNTVDCIGQQSVVQILDGILWAGTDGFYFSDGYKVLKLSREFDDTYAVLVDTPTKQKRLVGAYDGEEHRIWWACQRDVSSLDNDGFMVLDLRFGIKPDACFTTASGGDSFAPTAAVFFKRNLIRGDKRGYLFRHDPKLFSDLRIDELLPPQNWPKKTIIWSYKSTATNFGTSFVKKWVPRILITAANVTNVSIQIISINDDQRKTQKVVPIRFRGNLVWGDPQITWGDSELLWNYEGLIEEQRRFVASGLRCSYKQIQITNAFTAIENSNNLGTATVNAATKTIVLDTAPASKWPIDPVGYFIALDVDNYTKEYEILARTNDTLTVLDSNNQLINGSFQWVIRGYPKDEALHLLAYTLHYGLLGKTQDSFKGETGEVIP